MTCSLFVIFFRHFFSQGLFSHVAVLIHMWKNMNCARMQVTHMWKGVFFVCENFQFTGNITFCSHIKTDRLHVKSPTTRENIQFTCEIVVFTCDIFIRATSLWEDRGDLTTRLSLLDIPPSLPPLCILSPLVQTCTTKNKFWMHPPPSIRVAICIYFNVVFDHIFNI